MAPQEHTYSHEYKECWSTLNLAIEAEIAKIPN